MKTWITYPVAIILGFSAQLLLGGSPYYEKLLDLSVPFVRDLVFFILFPVVFILFAAAVASTRRHKDTSAVFSLTIVWALFTTLILSFGAMFLTFLVPQGLISFSGASGEGLITQFFDFKALRGLFLSDNAFTQFTVSSFSLLPILVVAFLVGIVMRPNKEEIRPAYVVLNSFSEVAIRLSRLFAILSALFLIVISASWFRNTNITALLKDSYWYVLALGAIALATIVVVLPLLYTIFTLFKGQSPYRIGFRAYPALFSSALAGNLLFGTTSLIALSNQNNKVRKRVAATSIPILTIIGRGGSAMVATFTIIEMLKAVNQGPLSILTMIFIALFSALFSIAAAFSPGFEVPFIVMMVLYGFNYPSVSTAVGSLIILLPLIQLVSILIDSAIAAYGSVYISRVISPEDKVSAYKAMM